MSSFVFFATVALFLVLNLVVGLSRTKGMTISGFRADMDRHGAVGLAFSVVGTIVGGGMFLAVGQMGYEGGVVGYALGAASLVGLAVLSGLVPLVRKRMTAAGAETLVDLLDKSYSTRVATQFAVVNALMYLFLLAAQFVAAYQATVFLSAHTAHTFIPWALFGLAVLVMLTYPVIGGLPKDISTDVLQSLLFGTVAAILAVSIFRANVLQRMWTELPLTHLTGAGDPGKGYGPLFLVGIALFVPALFLVRMDMWQRVRAARSSSAALGSLVFAAVASFLAYGVFTTVGIWRRMDAAAIPLADARYATLDFLARQFPDPIMQALMLGGLYAAILSSADTFTNNAAVFCEFIASSRAPLPDDRRLRRARLAALLMTLMALALGILQQDLVELIASAFTLLLVYLMPVLGLLAPSLRSKMGAEVAPLAGVTLFVVLFLASSAKLALAPAVVTAVVIYWILHALRR